MKNLLILITNKSSDAWAKDLAEIVKPLGTLKIVTIRDFLAGVVPAGCELIIIDATAVTFKTAIDLLEQLSTREQGYRAIIMTASPSWQTARNAFEAGAMDYISKNLPPAEVFTSIQAVMKKPVFRPVRQKQNS